MRVAYVSTDPGVPVFGRKGCSIHVQEVVRAMGKQAVEVELFAARMGGDPPAPLRRIPIHPLPTIRDEDPVANDRLWALLAAEGPFDMIYERYALWSYGVMEYAREAGVPGLLEVNAPLIEEQLRHRGPVDDAAARRVAARAFGAATALVAVSDEVATYLDGYPPARGRIHVVANGVDPERFAGSVEPSGPRQTETFTIGFVGSLKPWHDVGTLLEAFALLWERDRGYRLLIIGDGPERESLARAVAERSDDFAGSVRFTGSVDPVDIPRLLASVDVAVAPYSRTPGFYFSPLKVYEYMAAGLPVVVSRVGQLAGLIRDGINGMCYRPGDAAALATAIDRLRQDPLLGKRLGWAARRDVLENHTWDKVVRRLFGLAGLPVELPCHTSEKR